MKESKLFFVCVHLSSPVLAINMLKPAILFVCLLFALSAQSSAKHLSDGLIKNRIIHPTHVKNTVNIQNDLAKEIDQNDLLEEEFSNPVWSFEKQSQNVRTLEKPAKSSKATYDFRSDWQESPANESDKLQFFYDNHLLIALNEELDFEFDGFEITYFYYVYNAQDKTDHLHTVEYMDDKEKQFKVQFDKWEQLQFTVNDLRPRKMFTLKLAFSKFYKGQSELSKLYARSSELDSDELADDPNDSKSEPDDDDGKDYIREEKQFTIYIQSLTVKFSVVSGSMGSEVQFDVLNNNRFTAQVDFDQVSSGQLSNYLLLPQLTDEVSKYYYTFVDSVPLNWTLDNKKAAYTGDICLQFAYQATKQSILKLKVLNEQETSFFALLNLDGTEISFQDDSEDSPLFQRTKWTKVNVCLRDLYPNCIQLREFYRLQFESELAAGTNQKEFVAITKIQINQQDYTEKKVKNYLTNWGTNGTAAAKEWFNFFEDTQLVIEPKSTIEHSTTSLQLHLEGQSYTAENKSVCMLSEWFEVEESEELRFEIVSQMIGARYRIMLLDFQMLALDSTGRVEIQPGSTSVRFKFLPRVVSLFKNKPGRVKLVINYDPKPENLKKTLIVQRLHLSDPCEDENLCHKRGECLTLTSNVYQCACGQNYSGESKRQY